MPIIRTEPGLAAAILGCVAAGNAHRDPTGRDLIEVKGRFSVEAGGYLIDLTRDGMVIEPDHYGEAWAITDDGRRWLCEFTEERITGVGCPDPAGLMHLRSSWAAMSSCLIRLARHEDPSPDMIAEVPASHRSYLLGQAALQRHSAEIYTRHRATKAQIANLMDMVGSLRATGQVHDQAAEQIRGELMKILSETRGD